PPQFQYVLVVSPDSEILASKIPQRHFFAPFQQVDIEPPDGRVLWFPKFGPMKDGIRKGAGGLRFLTIPVSEMLQLLFPVVGYFLVRRLSTKRRRRAGRTWFVTFYRREPIPNSSMPTARSRSI